MREQCTISGAATRGVPAAAGRELCPPGKRRQERCIGDQLAKCADSGIGVVTSVRQPRVHEQSGLVRTPWSSADVLHPNLPTTGSPRSVAASGGPAAPRARASLGGCHLPSAPRTRCRPRPEAVAAQQLSGHAPVLTGIWRSLLRPDLVGARGLAHRGPRRRFWSTTCQHDGADLDPARGDNDASDSLRSSSGLQPAEWVSKQPHAGQRV